MAGAFVAIAAGTGSADASPTLGGCPIFPASSPWNQRIDPRPVDPRSSAIVSRQAAGHEIHLDLGSTEEEYGIPFSIVPESQPLLPLSFGVGGEDYRDESDRGPVPIPADAPIEGGSAGDRDPDDGDRHVITIQRGKCTLTELYAAERVRNENGAVVGWRAAAAARWNLRSNRLRPAGWTSADAAGLPIFPGLLRYEEAASGRIEHAIRFTLPSARAAYTAPARHCGPRGNTAAGLPAYGMRFRLKKGTPTSAYSGAAKVIVTAMKRYGLIYADQGSAMYVTGTSDPRWADAIDQFRRRQSARGGLRPLPRLPDPLHPRPERARGDAADRAALGSRGAPELPRRRAPDARRDRARAPCCCRCDDACRP